MICNKDLIGRGLAVYKRRITIEGCEDYDYDDGTHVYLLNSTYAVENADTAIVEFLRCIRTNDTDSADYTTNLMKEVCPAIVEIRSDPGKEAEYMTLQTKMMDIEYYAKEEGREEGIQQGIFTSVQNLMKSMGLSADEAMNVLRIPESNRQMFLSKLRQ